MDFIKRLYTLFRSGTSSVFGSPAVVRRPNGLEISSLAKIPVEILQQIGEELPTVSAALFSLSCRQIYASVGNQYLLKLLASNDETLSFLDLLEHDLPHQIVCHYCIKLHRTSDASLYTRLGHFRSKVEARPKCLSDEKGALLTRSIDDNFSTTVFTMAMKNYRLFGLDSEITQQLLKILSWKVRLDHRTVGSYVESGDWGCQIQSGKLFICNRMSFGGSYAQIKGGSIWGQMCPHLRVSSRNQSAEIRIHASEYVPPFYYYSPGAQKWTVLLYPDNSSKKKTGTTEVRSGLQQCEYCRTEYEAILELDGTGEIKFSIVIWRDLGPGPESEEFKAQNHCYRSIVQRVQFNGGEIAAVFKNSRLAAEL